MTATAERAKHKTRKAAESDSVEWLARLGLVSRGFLYVMVGVLAIRVASGSSEQADRHGALRTVGQTGVGRWLLLAVALGFAGYALWRFAEATVRPGDKSVWSRLGSAGRAVIYVVACASVLHFVITKKAENTDEKEREITAKLLDLPVGRYLVGLLGLVIVTIGLASAQRAITGRYKKHLKQSEIPAGTLRWLKPFAYLGLAARTVVFAVIGAFLVQSAVTYDPSKARGLDDSLRTLARAPYGEPMILVVAAGLIAFGLWCFVEARYRDVLGS